MGEVRGYEGNPCLAILLLPVRSRKAPTFQERGQGVKLGEGSYGKECEELPEESVQQNCMKCGVYSRGRDTTAPKWESGSAPSAKP